MYNYIFNKVEINIEKLQSEINFVTPIQGMSFTSPELIIYCEIELTTGQIDLITTVITNHSPALTQVEKDKIRFTKRASVKDSIIIEMASENMERVRNGIWTVPQLISLTEDTQLKTILSDINSLSYEIAYYKIDGITNPIVTSDIKNSWKAKLLSHFYTS